MARESKPCCQKWGLKAAFWFFHCTKTMMVASFYALGEEKPFVCYENMVTNNI